ILFAACIFVLFFFFFFFQAEDGIRDFHVTGVQTCALPIFLFLADPARCAQLCSTTRPTIFPARRSSSVLCASCIGRGVIASSFRSEERRVGKECRSWRSP